MFAYPQTVILFLFCALASASGFAREPESKTHFQDSVRPVLQSTCAECHGSDSDGPDLLKAQTAAELLEDRELWSSVAMQLRNRTMPPADETQPSEEDRLAISQWIDDLLRRTACDGGPFAGKVTVRRLNRYEYDNTLRDLFGVDMRFRETFPVDGSGGEGFDNNGETLFLPPILLERYLESAQKVLDRVIITPLMDRKISGDQFLPSDTQKTSETMRRVDAGEDVTTLVNVYTAQDYLLKTTILASREDDARLQLKIDGLSLRRFKVNRSFGGESEDERRQHETKVRLTRGLHAISVLNETSSTSVRLKDLRIKSYVSSDEKREQTAALAERQELHDRIFSEAISSDEAVRRKQAAKILRRYARRAYRRSINDVDIIPLMKLYDRAAGREDPFEERVKLAIKAMLVSPSFLFRIEDQTLSAQSLPESKQVRPLNDASIASRLSYFLWGTMPDDQLLNLADDGRLQDAGVLRAQVQRMLADERSRDFADCFVGQWLGTRDVGGRVIPSVEKFRGEYETELAIDFRTEAIELMHHILTENRSVLEFLDADYAFVNNRLSDHYGLPKVKGSKFQKVALSSPERGGVLGLGGVQLLTSYPDRTSPVLRGAWVLETLLGVKVPNPPPDIPSLKDLSKKNKPKTVRGQLELHRQNATCATCHDLIDPIGFGLDNFDVLGRWRDEQNGQKIDSRGKLPSGEEFEGPAELRRVLLSRKDDFVRQLCGKMLGYALGRSLEDRDSCTIEALVDEVIANEYRMNSLVTGIVLSTSFRYTQANDVSEE